MADLVLDPYSYAFHDDPYPTYARLRAEAPVYRNDELGFYALSRHADVVAGFGDAARLSSKDGPSADRYATGSHAERTASFLAMDRAVEESGMEYGGITPLGLPAHWRLLVDARIVDIDVAIVGSGVRRSKLLLPGRLLSRLPGAEIVEGLGV